MQTEEIGDKASAMMPDLLDKLERLVAIPSVAFPGYPGDPVRRMGEVTLELFREVGFTNAQLMDVPSGYPPIYGEIPGPEGSPTVVLYAHYDVQPAPPEQGWTSDPWTATRKDNGRIYGRGATLETRDAKHEPRSLAEQRVIWHAQAAETLGGPHAVQNMITHALNPSCTPSRVVDAGWVTATAKRVLAAVEERRSTWQSWHVRAEALRNVRSAEIERQS